MGVLTANRGKDAVGIANCDFDIQGAQAVLGGAHEARHDERPYVGPCRRAVRADLRVGLRGPTLRHVDGDWGGRIASLLEL